MRHHTKWLVLLTAATTAAVAACDPCAGVSQCTSTLRVVATGRILNDSSGRPVADMVVDFVRTGGAPLSRDSVRTRTNADGIFEFEVGAPQGGTTVGDVVVHTGDSTRYRVMDLSLAASSVSGDAHVFAPWSTLPHLPDIVVLHSRAPGTPILAGVSATFQQTGGVRVNGVTSTGYTATTNQDGWIPMFGNKHRPRDAGPVIGDLTVQIPAPVGASVRTDTLHATPEFRTGIRLVTWYVGPSLQYHWAFNRRGVYDGHAAGVQVEFVRTGGLSVTPAHWTETTDASGRVVSPMAAHGHGTVIGNMTITPPAPWQPFTRTGVVVPTFDEDGARIFTVMDVGPGLMGFVRIRSNGVPVPGVRVGFTRTSGVAVHASKVGFVTDDSGFVLLTAPTDSAGDVVGDVTVQPAAPTPSFTVHGVHVPSIDGDTPPRTIVGDWDLTAPPAIRRP